MSIALQRMWHLCGPPGIVSPASLTLRAWGPGTQISASWPGLRWRTGKHLKLCKSNFTGSGATEDVGMACLQPDEPGKEHTPHRPSLPPPHTLGAISAAPKENLSPTGPPRPLLPVCDISPLSGRSGQRGLRGLRTTRRSVHSKLKCELLRLLPELLRVLVQEVSKLQTHGLVQVWSAHQNVEGLQDCRERTEKSIRRTTGGRATCPRKPAVIPRALQEGLITQDGSTDMR